MSASSHGCCTPCLPQLYQETLAAAVKTPNHNESVTLGWIRNRCRDSSQPRGPWLKTTPLSKSHWLKQMWIVPLQASESVTDCGTRWTWRAGTYRSLWRWTASCAPPLTSGNRWRQEATFTLEVSGIQCVRYWLYYCSWCRRNVNETHVQWSPEIRHGQT